LLAAQKDESFVGHDDILFEAINHPVGQVTDAVFRWWYRQGLEDGQGLRPEPRGIYSELSDLGSVSFRYGRIIIASNIIVLFRVDREWTCLNVLSNFDWANIQEARAAWSGYLWSPRLYVPLLTSIREAFIDTSRFYELLGQLRQQYANLLTVVALE